MSTPAFTAALLRASLDGFAGLAASRLLELDATAASIDEITGWKTYQRETIAGLIAALDTGSPAGFAARSAWSRDAFAARGSSSEVLRSALDALRNVLEESLPPEAWIVLPPFFDRARGELTRSAPPSKRAIDEGDARGMAALRYLDALLAQDEHGALAVVLDQVTSSKLDARDALESVLVPALREVGRLWHRGEIGVAEEHFATSVTRRAIERILAAAPRATPCGKTVIVASAAGDAHDIAVHVVAAFFELEGWRTLFLGANVPAPDLTQLAVQTDADIVALGATIDTQRESVARTIVDLRAARPGLRVIVGGGAFAPDDGSWRRSGADALAISSREAVAIATRLCDA